MALAPGTRVGPYEVTALLGAGGMGEVYRARDPKLNRDVALKIVPETFTLDGDRVARFHREAQVLASLNDAHIAAIYGFEDSGSTHALVLELVEGPTLADRIAEGPIPVDEALRIARQIAEALDAAHEHGIIHRDLKPANIKVRGDGAVKVLDFGLAKALEPATSVHPALANSPTITTPAQMTGAGMLLGTAAYMSPEQAKGRPADKRSDIWAFGCVLFEMLTGKRTFDGERGLETLAVVLTKSPVWDALPLTTPAPIRRLLQRCLEKDPKRRLADVSDARLEIDEATDSSAAIVTVTPPRDGWRTALPWALAVGCGATALAMWAPWRRPLAPPSLAVARFSITVDGRIGSLSRFASISPDGTKIVYATDRLYIRPLADATARPIAGTEVSDGIITDPAFSPDGSRIAFWSGRDVTKGELKQVAVESGEVRPLTPASAPVGISWSPDGIVYAQRPAGIFRVSPDGGQPQPLVALKDGEAAIEPQMLPGQNAVLFTYLSRFQPNLGLAAWDKARIVVQSLATGQRTVAVDGGSGGRYVSSGHLLYAVGGTLLAVPFDTKAQRATGPPVLVLDRVRRPALGDMALGNALFSVSDTGSLLYIAGGSSARLSIAPPPNPRTVLALMNGKGDSQPLDLPPSPYESPHVSPDGKRIAYSTDDGNEATVWIYDLSGGRAPLRLTVGPEAGRNRYPIWTPDGQRIAFQSNREGDNGIFWQRADGTGTAERLTRSGLGADSHVPQAWSRTGDVLLFTDRGPRPTLQVLTMADRKVGAWGGVAAGGTGTPIIASFSPDGRWVAYAVVEENVPRVYVQPFPATGAKYQVAVTASMPVWSRNGHELFYWSNVLESPRLSSVKVTTSPAFAFTNPTSFELRRLAGDPFTSSDYDVLIDGRFIYRANALDRPAQASANPPIQVVLNWFEELKQRAPVK